MKNSPKVSVIVPMFNAEKFLGACLESVLIQTLEDFEVIVVDDCSTDSSVSVAESFLEKFDGRLKIFCLEKNSGSGAVPRNEGLRFSRGEYIFFLDADDLLVPTALEELFNAAEKFSADVVHTEQAFTCDEDAPQNLTPVYLVHPKVAHNKIFVESDDLAERMETLLHSGYSMFPWAKFSRRDFLLANNICFPQVKVDQDALWTIKIVCLAKKILRVPNRLYVWRTAKNSVTRVERTPEEKIKFRFDLLVKGLDFLDEFMDSFEFFTQNPHYRFDILNNFVRGRKVHVLDALKEFNRYEFYELIHEMFKGRHAALIANLFVNLYRNELKK